MRKIAIMQPYVFPYLGYFQLIEAVDLFVFYNDVNFIKKGWIHRNKILLNDKDFLFTIPCVDASQNKRICDTRIAFEDKEKSKFLATISQAYKKAPFFAAVSDIIEKVLSDKNERIDHLAMNSVREVCSYLGMDTALAESNERYNNEGLKREERLIDICLKEKIDHYINPVGGQEIYSKEYFRSRGIELQFLNPNYVPYTQFKNDFVPWLSIIDVLMFNPREKISTYLTNFELV